jgi:hypothetical protein
MRDKKSVLSFVQPHECKEVSSDETHVLFRFTCAAMGKDWYGFAVVKKGYNEKDLPNIKKHCFENCRIFNRLEVGFGVPGLFVGNVISPPATLRPNSELFKKFAKKGLLK